MGGISATSSNNPSPDVNRTSDAGSKSTGRTIEVHNSQELQSALQNAQSGDKIHLADGVYEGNFTLDGKSNVTIEGSKNAVIKGGSSDYALHLNNSNNITLSGFTVSGGQKGIVLDGSNNNMLNGLTVTDTGQEGIHFRNSSSNNVLQNSFIDNTGLTDPGFGEGVYIGSDPSNFANDQSNNNAVINNTFGNNVRAENVDIKENTSGGVITGNKFNITGISHQHSADSAVDVKNSATGYDIYDNTTTGASAQGDITFQPGAKAANSVHNNNLV